MNKLHLQLQQFINLSLLLVVGRYTGYIYLTFGEILGLMLFGFFIEHLFYYLRNHRLDFISFSSLTTTIGIVLMLVSTHYYIYFIILMLGILQKHYLKYNNKHFFNPSNFALIVGLVLFYKDAHIVLGQLGNQAWVILLVVLLALFILYRVKRWILPVSFILAYSFIQYFLIVSTDPILLMDDIYYRFYSVSFIVFICFMLTDPQTTPHKYKSQIIFAISLALSATCLDYFYGFRIQHLFMVLFVLTPLSICLEQYFKAVDKKICLLIIFSLLVLSLSAIIYIEIQPPYYLEMDG